MRNAKLWPCTVDGCNKDTDNHTEIYESDVIHHRDALEYPGPSDVEWPLDVSIVTYDAVSPHWRMMVDVFNTSEELTAQQVQYIAVELAINATYVADINAAIDATKEQAA